MFAKRRNVRQRCVKCKQQLHLFEFDKAPASASCLTAPKKKKKNTRIVVALKMAYGILNLLPPSVYYNVLIFNAIKKIVLLLSVCSSLRCKIGFGLPYNGFHVSFDKFILIFSCFYINSKWLRCSHVSNDNVLFTTKNRCFMRRILHSTLSHVRHHL